MIKCNEDTCQNEKIKFEGCCFICPNKAGCDVTCKQNPDACGESENTGTALEAFNNTAVLILNNIAGLIKQKAEIEATEKDMRAKLESGMVEHSIKKIDHEILKISYIDPTTRTSVDSAKLKKTYPHIFDECSKTSDVKGYVKIELKK